MALRHLSGAIMVKVELTSGSFSGLRDAIVLNDGMLLLSDCIVRLVVDGCTLAST